MTKMMTTKGTTMVMTVDGESVDEVDNDGDDSLMMGMTTKK